MNCTENSDFPESLHSLRDVINRMATSTLVLNKNYIDLELTNVSDEQLAWFQGAASAMVGNYRVVNAVLDPRKEIVYVSLALVSTKQKIDMDLL